MTPDPPLRPRDLVESEISGGAPEVCAPFVDALRTRFGDALAAVLFYGSCLRRRSDEGVLDFYALVDGYRAAYPTRGLAALNRALPPNVFYLEAGGHRAKVAVVSLRDFARGVSPRAIRPLMWARFCQPFAAAYLRDDTARDRVLDAADRAITTAVVRGLGLAPHAAGEVRTTPETFFTALFRETYASELRPERDASVEALVSADAARYARVLAAALGALETQGRLAVAREGPVFVVRDAPGLLGRRRRLRRFGAKTLGAVALLKSAFTFGDWMPYALWKLERHTGTRLEPSERQLRHPFLFAWPLIFRVLAKKELR